MGQLLSFPFEYPISYFLIGLALTKIGDMIASRCWSEAYRDPTVHLARFSIILFAVAFWPVFLILGAIVFVMWLVFPGFLEFDEPLPPTRRMPPPPPPPPPPWPSVETLKERARRPRTFD